MKAIECKKVSKAFGKKQVLKDITFSLEQGRIYGLLGRNGSGKTTLMQCLCTLLIPEQGAIFLLDEEAYENEKVLKEICFMSDYIEVFDAQVIKTIFKYATCFYEKWDKELMERLMKMFQISPKSTYRDLSKGQKTAVSIIIGLCSGCEIVLFDEIYSGLDAVARKMFYEILLEEQEKNPRTFFLSTHLIEEMAEVLDEVLLLHDGSILIQEEMDLLYEKSITCIGRSDQEQELKGKNVLRKKAMGSLAEYSVYDSFTQEEKKILEQKGFTFRVMGLQDLFVAYTTGENEEWREENGSVER